MNRNGLLLGIVVVILLVCGIVFFNLWQEGDAGQLDDESSATEIQDPDDAGLRKKIKRSSREIDLPASTPGSTKDTSSQRQAKSLASLSGRVIKGGDKSTVAKIEVRVTTILGEAIAAGKTEEDGIFTVKALPYDTELSLKVVSDSLASKAIPGLFLSEGQELELGDIEVFPATEIRGKVTKLGKNLPGANVALLPNVAFDLADLDFIALIRNLTRDDDPLGLTITDDSGNFVFENVVPGEYAVAVTAEGREFKHSDKIRIKEGAALAQVKVDLLPGCTIKGTVKDTFGQPIGDALIAVLRDQRGGIPSVFKTLKTRSDANGHFQFTQLGKSGYQLMARARGFAADNERFDVEKEKGNKTIEMTLKKGVTISGRITRKSDGKPIEGVEIVGMGGQTPLAIESVSDADGNYVLRDISPKGRIAILARHKRYKLVIPKGSKSRQMPGAALEFKLNGDEGSAITRHLEMTGGGTIKGRVVDEETGKGIANAQIKVQSVEDMSTFPFMASQSKKIVSDANGDFVFEGATPGRFIIGATARGYFSKKNAPSGLGVFGGLAGGKEDGEDPFADLPFLEDGAVLGGQVITLTRGLTQVGQTLDPAGNPLPGAIVRWLPAENKDSRSVRITEMMAQAKRKPIISDQSGKFSIPGIKRGIEVEFSATHPKFASGAKLKIAADLCGKEPITLKLQPGVRLHGQVIGPDGPFAGLTINARPEDSANGIMGLIGGTNTFTTVSDKFGQYAFDGLPIGRVRLQIETPDGFTIDGGSWQSVRMKPGADRKYDLKVSRVAYITGFVVDQGGNPIANVQMSLFSTLPNGKNGAQKRRGPRAFTDAKGQFKMNDIKMEETFDLQACFISPNLTTEEQTAVVTEVFSRNTPKDSKDGFNRKEVWSTVSGVKAGDREIKFVLDTSVFKK